MQGSGGCEPGFACGGFARLGCGLRKYPITGGSLASRSRTTFQKRQKELARAEKQRDKAAKRQQRKLERQLAPVGQGPQIEAISDDDDAPSDDLD